MTDFNATLTRAFAEAHEPADDGFSVNIGHAVARHERLAKVMAGVQTAGATVATVAVGYGLWSAFSGFAPDLMASVGLEFAKAHGAISQAPTVANNASVIGSTFMNSIGAGLSQIMMVTGLIVGGAVAVRSTQVRD